MKSFVTDFTKADDNSTECSSFNESLTFSENLQWLKWIKSLSIIGIIFSLLEITNSIFLCIINPYDLSLSVAAITGLIFVGSLISLIWAVKVTKAYKQVNDLIPASANINETFTKIVFFYNLVVSIAIVALYTNISIQKGYANNSLDALASDPIEWESRYFGNLDLAETKAIFSVSYLMLEIMLSLHLISSLLTAKGTFSFLIFTNRAVSQLVFFGSTILFGFGLAMIWQTQYASLSAGENFESWLVEGNFATGITLCLLAVIAFIMNHRNWRFAFFIFSAILTIVLFVQINFTGFAYRNTRTVQTHYGSIKCFDQMQNVHMDNIIANGCPFKYMPVDFCDSQYAVTKWESGSAFGPKRNNRDFGPNGRIRPSNQGNPQPNPTDEETMKALQSLLTRFGQLVASQVGNMSSNATHSMFDFAGLIADDILDVASKVHDHETQEGDEGKGRLLSTQSYCLNTACCGVVGELYSDPYLTLANYSLLAVLTACLISVGCYYFWYISWIDTSRDKSKDWIWAGFKGLLLVGFVVCIFVVQPEDIRVRK